MLMFWSEYQLIISKDQKPAVNVSFQFISIVTWKIECAVTFLLLKIISFCWGKSHLLVYKKGTENMGWTQVKVYPVQDEN